jgi:DNA topoisomerase-2
MAIWSLTQERVEKLLKQIGEKQEEIDTLIKLSPKDIWAVDLEAFMDEWNLQIEEDGKRKKKIAGITRRASQKLGIGAGKGAKGKKKRKAGDSDSDDSGSDFGPVKKKAKPKEGLLTYLQQEPAKKPTAAEALKSSSAFGSTAPQKQGTLLAHLVKKKEESPAQFDGASDSRPATADSAAPPKRGRPAAAKAVKKETRVIVSDDDDTDVFAAVAKEAVVKEPTKTIVASRGGRAATKQAPKYNLGSDSDDDDDDLLGDVSSMVKTIGSATNGVPMFKATTSARPGSNSSARPGAAKKNSPIEIDDDETNYEGLMPQPSPKRPAPRNVNDTIMSSDDDSDLGVKKPAAGKLTAKPTAKPKPAPKPKVVAKKPAAQSPAAKAYAKKHGKEAAPAPAPKKKPVTIDSDEDEDMEDADAIANDILSDEDEDEPTPKPKPAAARPGRRAAAAKPARYVSSDDEDEEAEASEPSFDDDDSE